MILGKCQENPSDVKEKTNKKAKVFFFVRQSGGGRGDDMRNNRFYEKLG